MPKKKTVERCWVWLDGWRIATVERGWKLATIRIPGRNSKEVMLSQLQTRPIVEKPKTAVVEETES